MKSVYFLLSFMLVYPYILFMGAQSMSKKTERINKLMNILKVRGYVSVRELSTLLHVSEMTVRRDLKILQENDVAENISGRIVYNPAHTGIKADAHYTLTQEQQRRNAQKEAIGQFAASLIQTDDIIIVDTGSTTEKIISCLPADLNLSVLCYNINILMELRRNPGVNMLFAGGRYHPNTQMFESSEGIDFIRTIRAAKVFLSAAGIHADLGITCMHDYEVPVKQAILKSSVEKILVADSSKFGLVRSSFICELSEIDTVITDQELSRGWRDYFHEKGITLYTVSESN